MRRVGFLLLGVVLTPQKICLEKSLKMQELRLVPTNKQKRDPVATHFCEMSQQKHTPKTLTTKGNRDIIIMDDIYQTTVRFLRKYRLVSDQPPNRDPLPVLFAHSTDSPRKEKHYDEDKAIFG